MACLRGARARSLDLMTDMEDLLVEEVLGSEMAFESNDSSVITQSLTISQVIDPIATFRYEEDANVKRSLSFPI